MPPAGASAGPPARRAAVSVGDAAGSDPDDPRAGPGAGVPGGHPGDQPATADGDQHLVEVRGLLAQLAAERAGAHDGLALVERVDGERVALPRPVEARPQRVVVRGADEPEVGAVVPDAGDLRG